MNGDVEHAISFRLVPRVLGGHTHVEVEVWAGAAPPTGRGHCGTIVLRNEEWRVLSEIIRLSAAAEVPEPEEKTLTRFEGTAETRWRPVYADDPVFVIDEVAEL